MDHLYFRFGRWSSLVKVRPGSNELQMMEALDSQFIVLQTYLLLELLYVRVLEIRNSWVMC
jgi:hypothetical protein